MTNHMLKAARAIALLIFMLSSAQSSFGYSVLTHQAIIDSTWKDSIKPLLLQRYPQATEEQLREAHAYAYGGAIIQDMGYYPLGSKFFTDLVHYTRSGVFVEELIKQSQDLNQYAFALGALAHYCADNNGHSLGVNRAVPIAYPKLRAKFGDEVTYAEDPSAHIKTEFGFDVVQVARGHYKRDSYHDFIGFKVSKPVLERAFANTYGLELKDQFVSLDLAIGTFRRAVSGLIPEMTRVAWELKKDDIEKGSPGITRDQFVYNLSRADYEKDYGKDFHEPGFGAKMTAWVIRVLPKVGPLKPLAFKPPTPDAERMFMESFNATIECYRAALAKAQSETLVLESLDFDTGKPTRAGEYKLADEAYAKLLEKLAKKDFATASPDLRQDILAFYRDLNAPIATKRHKDDWQATLRALDKLKTAPAQPARANSR